MAKKVKTEKNLICLVLLEQQLLRDKFLSIFFRQGEINSGRMKVMTIKNTCFCTIVCEKITICMLFYNTSTTHIHT